MTRAAKPLIRLFFFCLVNTKGIGKKNRQNLSYLDIPSAIRPIQHSENLPVPLFTGYISSDNDSNSNQDPQDEISDYEESLTTTVHSSDPQSFNQCELNDMVRDLALSKKQAELLASRLNEKNLLDSSAKVSSFRKRESLFECSFSKKKNFVFCRNIEGLLKELGLTSYNPEEWRLFLDSSKRSLKCVLLHNGNVFGAVPIGYSVHLKETYDEI